MYNVKQQNRLWIMYFGDRPTREAFTNEQNAKTIAKARNERLCKARQQAQRRAS